MPKKRQIARKNRAWQKKHKMTKKKREKRAKSLAIRRKKVKLVKKLKRSKNLKTKSTLICPHCKKRMSNILGWDICLGCPPWYSRVKALKCKKKGCVRITLNKGGYCDPHGKYE